MNSIDQYYSCLETTELFVVRDGWRPSLRARGRADARPRACSEGRTAGASSAILSSSVHCENVLASPVRGSDLSRYSQAQDDISLPKI